MAESYPTPEAPVQEKKSNRTLIIIIIVAVVAAVVAVWVKYQYF